MSSRKNLIALVLVALLPPMLGVCLFPAPARAGIVGSPHDFSRTGENYKNLLSWPIAPGGACSACHIPHRAPDNVGWPRDLSYYSRTHSGSTVGPGKLDLRDGTLGKPDYLRNTSVPCYDCHDRHLNGLVEPTSTPLLSDFVSSYRPQNILSGFKKVSLGSMTEYSPGPQSGKVVPGYYESSPPGPSANFGATDPPPPLSQTGGHHFKADPRGSAGTGADQGDKLPCSDCHDPHAWDPNGDWQAFYRKNWPTGTVLGNLGSLAGGKAIASSFMANPSTPVNRRATDLTGANGRYLCVACHGTNDSSTYPNRVRYTDVSSEYDNSSQIVGLPDTVGEHFSDSYVACVSCHYHSSIAASCTMCHGFPPSTTATVPYPANFTPNPLPAENDSHARHYGARSGEARNANLAQGFLYTFDCKECHFGSSMGYDSSLGHHQNDNVSVVIAARWSPIRDISTPKGNASALNYFNRDRTYPPLQSGTKTGQLDNSTNTATGWGAPGRYGGNTCKTVYCHSAGIATDVSISYDCTVFYRPVSWNTGKKACNACHGFGTSSLDNATYNGRVNLGMPSYANTGPMTARANSHLAHVMVNGYECSVCHYNTVTGAGAARAIRTDVFPTLHVNTSRNVVFDGTSASGTYDNGTKGCNVTCHGSDSPRWGGTLTGGCFACHSGVESAGKPQPLAGDPNPMNLQEYIWSGHGRKAGTYTATGNPPAYFDNYTNPAATNECYTCHSQSAAHTSKNGLDPYRLGSAPSDLTGQIGSVKGAFADNIDRLCLACHGSDVERAGRPEAAQGLNSINTLTHADGITGDAHTGQWPVSPWKCVDCHDPHGDGISGAERLAMVRSAVNAPTSSGDSSAGSDLYGTPRRTTPLAPITFTSTAGMAAGSYASAPVRGDGICEVCHTQTAFFNAGGTGNAGTHLARTGRCTICHVHKAGFKGLGGPDVGQYFDRAITPGGGAENLNDNSSHPLTGLTDNTLGSLLFGLGENCLGCHFSSGPPRTSNECLKCHFEEGNAPITNHMDGIITLARITSNTSAPVDNYPITSLVDFDGWCLQCHATSTFTLGGRAPSASRGTLISPTEFAAGRHRAQSGAYSTGCIYCHAVHGEGNAQLVRHNAPNRAGAGFAPRSFTVFPNDNLDLVAPAYGKSGPQNVPYRARVDNTATSAAHNVFADAADENRFCSTACHGTWQDHILLRNGTTGAYVLSPANRKIHLIDNQVTGVPTQYTIDNLTSAQGHIHPNGEIIPTVALVDAYATAASVSGPVYYHYPNVVGSVPSSYTTAMNADYMNQTYKIPLFPDFTDGSRDFGGTFKYRYTCSSCHNPHGTAEPNVNRGSPGWPDLRHRRNGVFAGSLCAACH